MNKERGSILLICLYVISAFIIIGAAFSVLMANEKLSISHDLQAVNAMYLAEAGMEKTIYDLRQQYILNAIWNGNTINGTVVTPVTGQLYTLYTPVSLGGGAYSVEIMNGTNALNICGLIAQGFTVISRKPFKPTLSYQILPGLCFLF